MKAARRDQRGYEKAIAASACWVGDGVGWLTDTIQLSGVEHTTPEVPNGPFTTLKVVTTSPEASEVVCFAPWRSQSPSVVCAPSLAHSITIRLS